MLNGDYEIREVGDGDGPSLRRFVDRLRAGAQSRAAPMGEGFYVAQANGSAAERRAFVALHGGEVVACFAGRALRTLVGGEERTFVRGLDGACLSEHAAALGGAHLPVRVAQAYFEHYGGLERDLVHFGLPGEEAARAGDRELAYEVVRNQLLLVRDLEDGSGALPAGVELLAGFDHQARWLYDRCCGAWGASAVRDDAFLNARFLDRPERGYAAFGARDDAGLLRGAAVYRRAACALGDAAFAVDWLVPEDEPDVAEVLVAALEARALEDGASALVLTAPEWSYWFAELQEHGFRVHPTELVLRARAFHPKLGTLWLRDSWWYQLAETDLV